MDMVLLRKIADNSAAGVSTYLTSAEGMPFIQANLATVNGNDVDPSDANKRGVRITDAGVAALNAGAAPATQATAVSNKYAVQTGGIELPKIKRGFQKGQGGGGAPSKYPFDSMDVNGYFFVPNSDVKNGNAAKTLSSAAGSANQRYAEGTGVKKTVQRAKRGSDHKAVKGADGKNVMETVEVEEKNFTRKYTVRPVEADKQYGNFTAPADGAVVVREK